MKKNARLRQLDARQLTHVVGGITKIDAITVKQTVAKSDVGETDTRK